MFRNATLASEHRKIPDYGTSGNTCLTCYHHTVTKLNIVGNMYLVIDHHTVPNNRVLDGATNDRRVGTDSDIITDEHATNVRDTADTIARDRESEALRADTGTRLDTYTVTDNTKHHGDVVTNLAIIADPDPGPEYCPASNVATCANFHTIFHDRKSIYS